MATVGQCRACGRGVSDEALACPKCGQPNPCIRPPAVGSRHRGLVESVYRGEDRVYYTVLLPSGIRGIFSSARDIFVAGAEIEVTVAGVDRVNGEVRFENR